ncbi:MAG: hypothetical protein HOV80_17735 [Polyangiaceae bacterium]|nr:hypothetical protein [Polyangiaceae bacterium]
MIIGCVGDNHFDETHRFDECVRLHDWIADDGSRRGVELWLLAGDLFERKSTIRERLAAARFLQRLADTAPVLVIRGNHDVVGDLQIFSKIRARCTIFVDEGAGVHTLVAGPRVLAHVACLSWPRKAEVRAMLERVRGEPLAGEEAEAASALMLKNVLRGLGAQLGAAAETRPAPRILLAHAMVRGSITSHGQPLVGCDFELGLEDLALVDADVAVLGHIHKPQEWAWQCDGVTTPILYTGSPRRTAFGEIEEKGYVILDMPDEGRNDPATGLVGFRSERIPTPCSAMILVDAAWNPETRVFSFDGDGINMADPGWWQSVPMGAEMRFRYRVDSDQRDAARAAAEQWADLAGKIASVIKIEEVVQTTTRARVPEMAQAVTTAEQLDALWSAKGLVIEESRRDRLRAKLDILELAA